MSSSFLEDRDSDTDISLVTTEDVELFSELTVFSSFLIGSHPELMTLRLELLEPFLGFAFASAGLLSFPGLIFEDRVNSGFSSIWL